MRGYVRYGRRRRDAAWLAFHGVSAMVIGDVGVAGLWRLFDRLDEIASWRVTIVVAGMEGALFERKVSGLVIAVATVSPTSMSPEQPDE